MDEFEFKLKFRQLEEAEERARVRHKNDMLILGKLAERNRLLAEQNKIGQLIKSDRAELCRKKQEEELMVLDYRIELAKEEAKQTEVKYQLEIELPAQLKAYTISRASFATRNRIQAETRAEVFRMKQIAQAKLAYGWRLRQAETSGLKLVAKALEQYYKALLADRLAGYVLRMIAIKFNIDPQFRLKLERPLTGGPNLGIELREECNQSGTSNSDDECELIELK